MKKVKFLYLLVAVCLFSCNNTDPQDITQESKDLDLAYRWAPIHYQDTDSDDPLADYITRFDYDENFFGNDNWQHLGTGDLTANAYYSVVESSTHWFIVYTFFHPRDWTDRYFTPDQEHENDAEGILMTIKKDGSTYGSFVSMITVAHSDLYSYLPNGSSVLPNTSVLDDEGDFGVVTFQNYDGTLHPQSAQESKGHGLYAFPTSDFNGTSGQDGIIYYPSKTVSELPSSGSDFNVKYKLINILPNNLSGNLWYLQLFDSDGSGNTFATWGRLVGDDSDDCGDGTPTCSINSAGMPWIWDDNDDGKNYEGEMALDPAKLVKNYFIGLGDFSLTYTRNQYLEDLKNAGFNNNIKPFGFPVQLNLTELYQKIQQ